MLIEGVSHDAVEVTGQEEAPVRKGLDFEGLLVIDNPLLKLLQQRGELDEGPGQTVFYKASLPYPHR